MGRIGLALVLLIGWGAVAQADRIACPRPFGEHTFIGEHLPIPTSVELDPDPHPGDKTPPATPADVIVMASQGSETWISVEGTFAPDTAYVQVEFDGYFFITPPDRLQVCIQHTLDAHARARVIAFDASQNQSAPFDTYVEKGPPRPWVEDPLEPHRDDHDRTAILITIGAIVLAGMELVLIGFARKKAPFSVAGEFLSPILAENIARAVARGYLIKLTVAIAIVMGLLALHHLNIAILFAPFAIVWLFEMFMTRVVLGQFESKLQRLERRENWIYINGSKLYAPHKIWEKASALPSATVSSRD